MLTKTEFNLTRSLVNTLKKPTARAFPPEAEAMRKDLLSIFEGVIKGARNYEEYLKQIQQP